MFTSGFKVLYVTSTKEPALLMLIERLLELQNLLLLLVDLLGSKGRISPILLCGFLSFLCRPDKVTLSVYGVTE